VEQKVKDDIRENPSPFRYTSHMEHVGTVRSTWAGDQFVRKSDKGWEMFRTFSSEQFSLSSIEKL
jgi:hypothetical protein